MGGTQAVHPLSSGREGDAVPGQAGPDAKGNGEMTLAGAGRAEEHGIGLGLDEVQGAEVGHHVLAHAALVFEVEVLDGLAGREAGGADAGFAPMGLAGGHLSLQTGGKELFMAPGIIPGPLAQALHTGQQCRVLELPAQVGEVTSAAHLAPVARS